MKKHSLFVILLSLFSFQGIGQSAVFLSNGVLLKVESNSVITINGDFNAKNSTDTALISNEGVIEILGNWNNDGTGRLTDNSTGNILFKGLGPQIIQGNTAFYNLEIENTSGVTITSGLTELKNELQLTQGNFATGGSFKLNSIASKTARIAPILTGSISDDVTIECFIENAAYDYRFLSMPVQNQTIDEWSDNILLTGFTGTPYPGFHFNNVFLYDETLSGDRNSRYRNATNVTDPVHVGVGAQIYMGAADIKVNVTGNIYSGVINFPVTYTDDLSQPLEEEGWNLVGNPYPSTIDWSSPNWIKTNMDDAIYVYEGSADNYQTYVNGVGTNGGTQYIASSQGFWVKANGAGVPALQGNENVKTDQELGFIERRIAPDLLRLKVSNGIKHDEIVVRYHEEATANFDPKWDAYKVEGKPINPIITAIQRQESYSILSMNPDSLEEVFLKIEVPASGNYALKVEDLPTGINCLFLEDLFTGRIESLRDSASYNFNLSDTTSVPRFKLTASKLVKYVVKPALCFGNTATIEAESISPNGVSLSWTSVNNPQASVDSNLIKKTIVLKDGVYHFKAESASCSAQEDYFTLDTPDSLQVQTTVTADTGFNSGAADLVILGGTAPYTITWGATSRLNGTNISGLASGNYQATIIDTNGCSLVENVIIPGVLVGLEKSNLENKLSVYPNPAKDFINISGLEGSVDYELIDGAGRIVLRGGLSDQESTIRLKQFSAGIYLLKLSSKEGTQSIKIKKVTE